MHQTSMHEKRGYKTQNLFNTNKALLQDIYKTSGLFFKQPFKYQNQTKQF